MQRVFKIHILKKILNIFKFKLFKMLICGQIYLLTHEQTHIVILLAKELKYKRFNHQLPAAPA